MAKIKVTNLKRIQSALRQKIVKALRDKDIRGEVGTLTGDQIQSTTFKSAAESTQKTRKLLEKKNKTHPTYARSKINITFTGELLDDLRKNVKLEGSGGDYKYIIDNSEKKHKRYKGAKGKLIGKSLSNKQIADYIKKLIPFDTFKSEFLNKLTKKLQQLLEQKLKGKL